MSVSAVNVAVMTLEHRDVAWLVASQRGVLSRTQAFACGITANGVQYRTRPGGPWQRLLPGIYLTTTGPPSRDQLLMAALVYAGSVSMITGPAALPIYSIRPPKTRVVDVLVPATRQRASRAFVTIHRTHRMPHGFTVDGGLRFAPAARAVADTARGLSVVSEARAVVASAVQQRKCTIQELGAELADGPIRDSARLRAVLLEVMAGVRSAPEAELRDLIRKSGLPLPLFNPQLFLNGEFLATPDAWWPDAGVIAEVDSREWHLSPADWENTMRRHARLSAAGIIVLHISPRQLHTEPDRVVRDIAGALRAGRPVPGIATRLAAA